MTIKSAQDNATIQAYQYQYIALMSAKEKDSNK
jgi:hypothetical protein